MYVRKFSEAERKNHCELKEHHLIHFPIKHI